MTSSRYLVGILGILLLSSMANAYTVLGSAFYCGNTSMTGDQICTDCTNALNNNTYNFTFLNATVSGATADCINDPPLIDFKTFNCNGYTISGTHAASTYGIDIEGETDATIIGCQVNGFSEGYYIADNSDNITVINAIARNNTDAGFRILSSDNISIYNATSYNNSVYGFWVQSSDDFEADNTTAYDHNIGYYIRLSDFGDYIDCNTSDHSTYGFWIRESTYNTIDDSLAYDGGVGVYISTATSNNNDLDNFTSYNHTAQGIYIHSADNNTVSGSNSSDNEGSGIEIYLNADDNSIQGTIVNSNGRPPGNTYPGIYIHETSLRNNITITNVSMSGQDGIRIRQSCDYTYIFNVISNYNNLSGINISQESDYTDILNSPIYGNDQHGIYIFNSDYTEIYSFNLAPAPFTNVYENNESGIYLEQAGDTNIAGLLRNLSVYSNGIHGIVFDQTSDGNLSTLNIRNHTQYGMRFESDSDGNTIRTTYIHDSTWHGVSMDGTANLNDFISCDVYENGWSGFGIDGANNVFDDNLVFGNTFHGFHINTNGNNNFTENEIYNNSQHGVFIQVSDNNNFWNNSFYGNGQVAGTFNIEMDNTADNNLFYNTQILTNKTGFETLRHVNQDATATTPNNFTNLTVCYNETIGCAAWNQLNLSDATLDSSNFVAAPQFISLDDSVGGGANEFNKSANLTIAVDSCSPMPRAVMATGFPASVAAILASGTTYPTTRTCSNNVFSFNVSAFSGYTANTTINACFYANNDNTVYNIAANLIGNKSDAICVTLNASNIMINCSGYSVTGNTSGTIYGIATGRTGLENITIRDCIVSNYSRDIRFDSARNVTVFNNTLYNSTYGIETLSTLYSLFDSNILYNNSWGMRLGANWTNVTNNIAYNNSGCGIGINPAGINSNFDLIANNIVYGNNIAGLCIYTFHNGTVYNNTAYNNSDGMQMLASWDNVIELNRLYNNSLYGLFVVTSSNDVLSDNTIYNNYDGLFSYFSTRNNYTNNTIYGNTNFGFHLANSTDANLLYTNLYNNGYDLFVNNSGTAAVTMDMVNTTFRNPFGTLVNYTMLSITDSIAASTGYTINWTAIGVALPANYVSFAQKFINITSQIGAVSIDSITWQWTDAELGGYNESLFVLSKYNASGWSYLNNTPDTVGNTLSLTNMNPSSDYGILQNNSPYCMEITSSGVYQLGANAEGAPYNSSEIGVSNWTCIKIGADNVVFSCNGYNITNNGTADASAIIVNGTVASGRTNITIRDCPSLNAYENGVYLGYTDDSLVTNVTAHNNTESGFATSGSLDNNRFIDNIAYENTGYGFYLGYFITKSMNNTISGNIAYDHTQAGIRLENMDNSTVMNSVVNDSTNWGIQIMLSSAYNNVTNNTVYDVGSGGYHAGIYLYPNSDNNTVCENTVYNSRRGIFTWRSDNNYICGGNIYNTTDGIEVYAESLDCSAEIVNVHLYDNTNDLTISSDGTATFIVNVTNATIDNPAGNFQNFTSVSINDTGSANEEYSVTWNPEPAALTLGYLSFEQKYVNITNTVGTSSIGQVRFNWYSSEIPGYNEDRFEVWKYNASGWSYVPGQTRDTTDNYLEILNLNPASTFGILQNNLSECMVINTSGLYVLNSHLVGAPINAAPVAGTVCVKIASSDVDLDCDGYTITNNGTAGSTHGIVLNGSLTNVTVRNCARISEYSTSAAYIYQSTNVTMFNNTAFNITSHAFQVVQSNAVNFTENTAMNNSNNGFRIPSSSNDAYLEDNTAYDNFLGFSIQGDNHVLVGNDVHDNQNGLQLINCNNCTFISNDVYNNDIGPGTPIGFSIMLTTNSTFVSNNVSGHLGGWGFSLSFAGGNNFTSNLGHSNEYAFALFTLADSNLFYNNTVYDNTRSGFWIFQTNHSVFIDNEAYNNSWHGFQVDNGMFNTFTYDVSYNNTIRGFSIYGDYTNLTNVTAYNNSGGIGFTSASFNIVESPNLFLNNVSGGYEIYFDSNSDRNTVSNAYLWQTTNYLNQDATAPLPNNLTNFSIAYNTTVGIINWQLLGVTDIQLDSTTTLPMPTFVSIDSVSEPQANVPANVSIYTPLCPNPTVYMRTGFPQSRGDILINGSIYPTIIQSCVANLVTFDVAGFSGYATGNYSNLTIWDSNDTGSVIYTGDPAKFFANYSNSTNGAPIDNTLGSCFVMYNDSATVYGMVYNATSLLWEHNKAFSNPGNYTWNVTCNSTAGYDTLFAEDNITILLGCFYADAAGLYTLPNNLTGNKTDRACITVNASNVIIDCGGYGISGIMAPGSGTYGILIDNVGSVELRNCYATAYDHGYYLDGATNSVVHNNTAELNFRNGFNVTDSTNVDLYNNNVTDNGNTGFSILGDNINVTNNTVDEGIGAVFGIFSTDDGVYGDGNTFAYNTVIQVAGGIGIFAAGDNNEINNNLVTNALVGAGIACGDDPTLPIIMGTNLPCRNANIYNNTVTTSFSGMIVASGDTVDVIDNNIYNNGVNFNVLAIESRGVLITGNEVNTSVIGLALFNTNDTLVYGNRIFGHTGTEISLFGNLTNITVEENVDPAQTYVALNTGPGPVNITDLYLTYNYSDINGMVRFHNVVDSGFTMNLNSTNFLLEQNFVSLNDTDATEFNTTADVTLYTAACPVEVFRLEGFPATWADIVTNGTVYAPTFLTCTPGSAQFGVTAFSGYAVNVTIVPPPPGGRGGGGPVCRDAFLELEVIECPGNKLLFVVTDEDDIPVDSARVVLVRETGGYWSDVRYTTSDGTVEFQLSSNAEYSVTVDGGSRDYCSDSLLIDYVLCPDDACYDDDDCLDNEYCDLDIPYSIDMPVELLDFVILPGICTPVDCECGEVYDHRCHEYDCCSNEDCDEGYVCENHECVPKGCDSDSDCGASQYCENGECLEIPIGDCGYIANHSWFDYECCEDDDCPEGEICYNHECMLYWIETNETGFVGDMHGLIVHPEGQYTLDITDPDGRLLEITTDAAGRSQFQLETEGKYGIELIEEEVPVIMVDVDALKRPLPPPDDKPITIIDEFLKYFWWLLILLLLIIGYILFRRRKKKKYHVKE